MSIVLFLLVAVGAGCTTPWRPAPPFYRTVQTDLDVAGDARAQVYVAGQYSGSTPLTVPLVYQQEVTRRTRKVSYWHTEPGSSLLFTLLSLGVYLPFSVIPVVDETASEPAASFVQNAFDVDVQGAPCGRWGQRVIAHGEERIVLRPCE